MFGIVSLEKCGTCSVCCGSGVSWKKAPYGPPPMNYHFCDLGRGNSVILSVCVILFDLFPLWPCLQNFALTPSFNVKCFHMYVFWQFS